MKETTPTGRIDAAAAERLEEASHYRRQAALARRVAGTEPSAATREFLEKAAQNFEEIADDIEAGGRGIRHVKWLQWSGAKT